MKNNPEWIVILPFPIRNFIKLMIRNYITIAFRNLLRHKFFTLINIFGLAAGMSICLLIISMLLEQKSYDQFHSNKDHIYRVTTLAGMENATTPAVLAGELEKYPVVEKTVRLKRGFGGDATHNQTTIPLIGLFADSTFLTVFDFPLLYGNPALALRDPFSIVLSQETAEKLFGKQNPVGQIISLDERGLERFGINLGAQKGQPYGDFTVTGVLAKTNQKTHIPLEAFISYATRKALVQNGVWKNDNESWTDIYGSTFTYALLKKGTSQNDLTAILDQIAQREYPKLEAQYQQFHFSPQPLTAITPSRLINNPISFQMPLEAYYFLGVLALLVMITAGFNYTNLSIARSLTRAKEVGVRKVSGAFRHHLFVQFVGESVLLSLLSLGAGIILFQVVKVGFVNLWANQYMEFELGEHLSLYLYFLVFGLVVGILAGLYPALYMSHYTPLKVLRSFKLVRPGGLGIRKVLITSQFTLSLIFIVSALIFYRQLDHYLHMEYGFSKENILNVELQGQPYEQMANQLGKVNTVEEISGCWFIPASGVTIGKDVQLRAEDDALNFSYMAVTPNYFSNHQIPIIAGSTFTVENAKNEIVINEKAVQALGFGSPREAVGTTLMVDGGPEKENGSLVKVTGVIRDFQASLPIQDIDAMLFQYDAKNIKIANVRILPTDIRETLSDLDKSWTEIDPLHPMEAKFLEDQLNTSLQVFVDIFKIFGFLTFLAISIALLGLLGMAVFTAESRIKEIGIRKVMGASTGQLIILLSKGFLRLLLVSVVFAVPLAYFGNNLWLRNFANQVPLGAGIFLSGIGIMLGLGLLVIISQTLRAALTNPVNSLKDE